MSSNDAILEKIMASIRQPAADLGTSQAEYLLGILEGRYPLPHQTTTTTEETQTSNEH